ncbi:hypothetical protein [Streptomyces sp. NPDC006463]|uniref:hypothetical protein n=1 Tax=Streptomyces sp. NPDC006463 TaxID=3364746 RepID=UPI0036CB1BB1
MAGVSQVVAQISQLDAAGRRKAASLLVIRYCSFHGDPKFLRWFGNARIALSGAVDAAISIAQEGSLPEGFETIRDTIVSALEGCDPDGPPFEAEIADHLNFASEVFDYLADPEDSGMLAGVYERADELAEAHQEMGEEAERSVVDLYSLEGETRGTDALAGDLPDEAVARSQAFAHSYAEVIEHYYSDEDAGIR